MEIRKELLQKVTEIGLLASNYGQVKEAEAIFEGLVAVRPDQETPYIGMAMAKMNSGSYDEALELLLEKALTINPESDLAKSFAALCYKLAGKPVEAKAAADFVVENGSDEAAVAMAKGVIEELGA
ncbi:MAG: hypothetical protein H0S85_02980 [Desulfovibrionaceae bacterium]|jgi:Tfp pilus assembly protein PilF|nr:hypothetical protein [Desulfovibrionaceae bacterium]